MICLREEFGRVKGLAILLVIALGALVPVALIGWQEVYQNLIEVSAPTIEFVEKPRGVGIAPARLVIQFQDRGAGLDGIIVRATQSGQERVIKEKYDLGGLSEYTLTILLQGREDGFREGPLEIQVRAFDRSLWSNRGEQVLRYMVDYRKPIVEVLTEQHNAQVGGSQLLLYKALDENLTVSGVKVGNLSFLGYPARLLDPEFSQDNLFAVIYAVPLSFEGGKKVPLKVFAEDQVGNAQLKSFYSKTKPRKVRPLKVQLTEACLRSTIHPQAEGLLDELARNAGGEIPFQTSLGSDARYLEEFKLLNEQLRPINEGRLRKLSKSTRFERHWYQPFLPQSGTVRYRMAERLAFFGGGQLVSDLVHDGYTYRERLAGSEVVAAGSGIVSFSEDIGVFGKVVGVDHGLGLSTVYGHLGDSTVRQGDSVEIGDVIGSTGQSGITCTRGVFFQVRVQGVPVEPTEWLSKVWYNDHVSSKIRRVKRLLGITEASTF